MNYCNKNGLVRWADTDDQVEAIERIAEICNQEQFSLRLGTKIGKHPQTIILDHKYQDGILYLSADGEIEFDTQKIFSYPQLKFAIQDYKAMEEVDKDDKK